MDTNANITHARFRSCERIIDDQGNDKPAWLASIGADHDGFVREMCDIAMVAMQMAAQAVAEIGDPDSDECKQEVLAVFGASMAHAFQKGYAWRLIAEGFEQANDPELAFDFDWPVLPDEGGQL